MAHHHNIPTNWEHTLNASMESKMREKIERLFNYLPDNELVANDAD
jgi:hypothetical protein